jgi:CTP:molybdopterin cytidylyltransferase MocA
MATPGLVGVVLAAGRSSRMGHPKQLAELGGRPMLEHVVAAMDAAGVGRVVVALGANADRIMAEADLGRASPMVASRWREGMGAVLAEALACQSDMGAAIVALGDQPLITPAVITRVVETWRAGAGPVVSAAYDGRPGHPKLFDRPILTELLSLTGDQGARELLAGRPELVTLAECGGLGDDLDVDDEAGLAEAARRLAIRYPGLPM